jgi:hypothetical protein
MIPAYCPSEVKKMFLEPQLLEIVGWLLGIWGVEEVPSMIDSKDRDAPLCSFIKFPRWK